MASFLNESSESMIQWLVHMASFLNESSESMIQWLVRKDSFLNESAFWMNQLNEWINDSLIKTDICRHLLVI